MPFFANPLFLWLLPLATLPVIFHLFFRVKKRPRKFPTLMFFHRLDPRLSARKQIKEWLILALRVLLLLLLLLALARPRWFAGWGGGSVAVVLVVDNSGSMSRPTGPTKPVPLATALEAANAVIGGLERSDAAGIVTLVEDPTVSLPPGVSSDKPALRAALNRIAPTEATGAVGDALRRAFTMLENSSATRLEVHIFTDLHEAEWKRAATEWPSLRAGVPVVVHRLTAPLAREGNITLTGIEFPGKRLLAGRPVPVRVHLNNPTGFDARARLSSVDDAGQNHAQELALAPGAEQTVTLLFTPELPGFHWFNVWLEGDSFAADNRAGCGYFCAEKSVVLFVGAPGNFGVLPVAMSPAAEGRLSGLVPAFVEADELAQGIADKKPLLVVQPASLPVPMEFVAQGGNILLVPDGTAAVETKREGVPVLAFQKGAPLFNDLRDDKGELALRNVKAFRFVPVSAADATPLLGLEDGRALLTERRLGKGRVFTSGLGFDPSWSTLPLKGSFLALAQMMALLGEEGGGEATRLVAGERPALAGNAPVHIRSLVGSPLDWKGPAANAPVLPRAGVYALETEGRVSYISVRAAAAEGRWQFLAGSNIPALSGRQYGVRNYTTPESLMNEFRVVSRGVDLYLPLLLLALAALLAEGWMANGPARKANSNSESRISKEPANRNAAMAHGSMIAALPLFGFPSDFGFRVSDFPFALVVWRGQLDVWLSGLVLLLVAVWLRWVYQRLLTRFPWPKALLLLAPKILVAALLILALFEPVWSRQQRDTSKGRLVALVDVSSSMDVADDGRDPRAARAHRILERISRNLPSDVRLYELAFDTAVRKPGEKGEGVRGTDLAGSLLALAERADMASALGVVVLTDGGDEKVQPAKMPGAPTSIIGIGSDSAKWNDIAVIEAQAPATVEKEIEFEITADLQARASRDEFRRRLPLVTVTLERAAGKEWSKLAEQTIDLSRQRARAKFKVSNAETGLQRYRVSAAALPGEVSLLNNARTLTVDVQKKALHVLYFTRELGMDFKMLRAELARDPGISFTALFRTLSERFTIQGDRLAGDDELEAGFPTSPATLKLYDCLILGSFPASDWNETQLQALVQYVEEGGAVVFLGGEKSFGRGGYAGSALAPLFPWPVAEAEAALASGSFPVNVPAAATSHAIMTGVRELVERSAANIESLNAVSALKPGATALLNAGLGARSQPVAAVQAFGKGKTLAVASNTLWKWATGAEDLKSAYGLFWRQAVRDLTGKAEGGRVLAVKWNKDVYRPGEQASVEVRVAGEQASKEARLAPTLSFTGKATDLPVEPVAGQPGSFVVKMEFRERGEYGFRLVAYQGEKVVETYEKALPIAPLLAEGANLELDEEYLRNLAEKGGGTYVREDEADEFVKKLAGGLWQKTIVIEKPLAENGPWFVLTILGVLVLEWIMRRRMNLF